MHHDFIDKFSDLQSPIHRLDPRAKVIGLFLYVLVVVVTPPQAFYAFFIYFILIAMISLLSEVPAGFIAKRSLVVVPFALVIGLFNLFFRPPIVFFNLMVKSWLSVLAVVVLSSTTTFPALLKAMESLKVPKIITSILAFMYRYIFTLMDQVMRMERARVSRSYGTKGLRQMRALGSMLGSLFVNTYERGERIYLAMLSRGFHGHTHLPRPFAFRVADAVFLAYVAIVLAFARLVVATW